MIRGGCLCGAIRFEVSRFVGPFELCHCSGCRKACGAAFAPMIGVAAEDFAWLSGRDRVRSFEAPVLEHPPGYRTFFCVDCGSPAPISEDGHPWFEVAAGLLDDDPGIRPDRHIFVECGSAWYEILDDLPRLTKRDVIRMRLDAIRAAGGTSREDS
jgi:hypothetical protein